MKMRRLLAVVLLAACLAPAAAAHNVGASGRPPPFEDVTGASGVAEAPVPAGGWHGACWTDDGDGWPDLVLRDAEGRLTLLRGVDGRRFERVEDAGGAGCANDAARGVVADLDDDGRTDALSLLPASTPLGEALRFVGAPPESPASWSLGWGGRALAAADFDRDGALDVAVVYASPAVRLLRNDGAIGRHVALLAPPGVDARVERVETDAGAFTATRHALGAGGALHRAGVGNATTGAVLLALGEGEPRRVPLPRLDATYEVQADGSLRLLRSEPAWPRIEAPRVLRTGERGAFTAAPGEPGASLAWEWGDGAWAWSASATHAYEHEGTFAARVHTTGATGARGVETVWVQVVEALAQVEPEKESPALGAAGVIALLAACARLARRGRS